MDCREFYILFAPHAQAGGKNTMVNIVRQEGRGIGGVQWRGAAAAAEDGSAAWAQHVKGFEMPGWEPRRSKATALRLAVGARRGSHNALAMQEATAPLDREYGQWVAVDSA